MRTRNQISERSSDGPVSDWYERKRAGRRAIVRVRVEFAPAPAIEPPARPTPSYPACVDNAEPCWAARCRHSLLTDHGGRVLEVHEDAYDIDAIETCSLRYARKGEHSIEEVATASNRSEEAVRKDLKTGIAKMAEFAGEALGIVVTPAMLTRLLLRRRK